ncbi:RNA chaperone Hfq [Rickettsiales bacterium LUAb2]
MKKVNLQDLFLNTVRKDKISVTIFLVNGVKLQGYVAGYDNFVITLKRDNQIQLVYKHSISTILPSGFINLKFEDEVEENKEQ